MEGHLVEYMGPMRCPDLDRLAGIQVAHVRDHVRPRHSGL
uniref:Uncharacterized protein n=1 Tax=Parascaris equorum TaxID=6256 RepID=A0A914RKB0_PAREQ